MAAGADQLASLKALAGGELPGTLGEHGAAGPGRGRGAADGEDPGSAR